MLTIEVEAVDDAECEGLCIGAARRGDGGRIALKLEVGLQGEVIGKGDVHTHSGRENVGGGLRIDEVDFRIGEPATFKVGFCASVEDVGVGAEASVVPFELDAAKNVLVADDLACDEGICAPDLEGRVEPPAEGVKAEVGACSDAEVSAAV
jgi:hypothetical protein